jgi:hypothetical protein
VALGATDRELLSNRLVDFADRHATPALAAKLAAVHMAAFPKHWGESGGTKRASEAPPEAPAAKKSATNPLHHSQAGQPTAVAASMFSSAHPAGAGPICTDSPAFAYLEPSISPAKFMLTKETRWLFST